MRRCSGSSVPVAMERTQHPISEERTAEPPERHRIVELPSKKLLPTMARSAATRAATDAPSAGQG